jgi:di/tripeptidase
LAWPVSPWKWKAAIRAGHQSAVAVAGLVPAGLQQEFGGKSGVQVIHAGLECGIIGAKSRHGHGFLWPTIRGAHAPESGWRLASVDKAWQLLKAVLAAVPRSA